MRPGFVGSCWLGPGRPVLRAGTRGNAVGKNGIMTGFALVVLFKWLRSSMGFALVVLFKWLRSSMGFALVVLFKWLRSSMGFALVVLFKWLRS
jgi:hypothetical protein